MITRSIVLVLFALSYASATSLDGGKNQPDANGQQRQTYAHQQETAAPPSTQTQPDPAALQTIDPQRDENIAIQRQIATFTKWLVIIGGAIGALQIGLMVWTALVSNKAAEAAKVSADAAKLNAVAAISMMELADRPWVKVTPSIRVLSIDEGDVRFALELRMENVGRSAAQFVRIVAGLVPWRPNLDRKSEQDRVINDPRLQPSRDDVILPTDSLTRQLDLTLDWSALEAAWKTMGIDSTDKSRPIRLALVGAVRYTHGQSTTNPTLHGVYHSTLFHGEVVCVREGLNTPITLTTNFKEKWPYGYLFTIEPLPDWLHYAD
jgi:hypothetical protein